MLDLFPVEFFFFAKQTTTTVTVPYAYTKGRFISMHIYFKTISEKKRRLTHIYLYLVFEGKFMSHCFTSLRCTISSDCEKPKM